MSTTDKNHGKISQIIGPVVDVIFEGNQNNLPKIYDALEVIKENNEKLILECEQHIGENSIRTIAMDSTDGLKRGMEVVNTGNPILMPVGESIKGRLLNVVGDAIDGIGDLSKENGYTIHREPPKFEELSTETEVLYTGIKVIDLIEPYAKEGKLVFLVELELEKLY